MGDLVLRSSETVLLQLVVNDDDVIINGLNGNRHKSNFSLCEGMHEQIYYVLHVTPYDLQQ